MGIKRGTILGLLAVAGAVVERTFGVLQGAAMDVLGAGPPPAVLGWIGGCFVGVVAGDLVTWLVGGDVSAGRWVGIRKGLVAAVVAALGFYASTTGIARELLGPSGVGPVSPEVALLIGTTWLGGVLADLFGG
jgi:hypothetical protein